MVRESIDEAAARRGGGEDRGRGEDTHDGTCAAADRFGRSDMVGLALLALCTICMYYFLFYTFDRSEGPLDTQAVDSS